MNKSIGGEKIADSTETTGLTDRYKNIKRMTKNITIYGREYELGA